MLFSHEETQERQAACPVSHSYEELGQAVDSGLFEKFKQWVPQCFSSAQGFSFVLLTGNNIQWAKVIWTCYTYRNLFCLVFVSYYSISIKLKQCLAVLELVSIVLSISSCLWMLIIILIICDRSSVVILFVPRVSTRLSLCVGP